MTDILGIDPGASGAIAKIGGEVAVWDMPSTPKDLVDLLAQFKPHQTVAFVEQAQSMPGQGVASSFKYGVGFGTILGALAALGIPHRLVTPAMWKRQMGIDKDKEKSRGLAQQLFPTAPLPRKKDHGRAEALLIAEWGRRNG